MCSGIVVAAPFCTLKNRRIDLYWIRVTQHITYTLSQSSSTSSGSRAPGRSVPLPAPASARPATWPPPRPTHPFRPPDNQHQADHVSDFQPQGFAWPGGSRQWLQGLGWRTSSSSASTALPACCSFSASWIRRSLFVIRLINFCRMRRPITVSLHPEDHTRMRRDCCCIIVIIIIIIDDAQKTDGLLPHRGVSDRNRRCGRAERALWPSSALSWAASKRVVCEPKLRVGPYASCRPARTAG